MPKAGKSKSKEKSADAALLRAEAAREAKFVAHYSVHFNGAAAVRFAGYETGPGNDRHYARELLTKPHIQAAIRKRVGDLGELHFELANEVSARLQQMAFADRTAILDADGNLIDPRDWPDDCKALLAGIEIEEQMKGEGEEAMLVRVKKVKLSEPKAILDSLAKITGQFIERSQMLGKDGKPVDPPAAMQAVVNITVGGKKV